MLFRPFIKNAAQNLLRQKMRSFLTMLGVVIGIASVILVNSVVAGAQSLITNQINSVGPNLIGVLPGSSDEKGPPAAVMGIVITTLKDDDTEALKKEILEIVAASSYISATETVSWEGEKTTATISGVSPDYPKISDAKISAGRFFSEDEKRSFANVIVLGQQVKDELFGNSGFIGEKIKIKNSKYEIIGAMTPQGTSGFQNVDNMVFVPVSTAQKKILGINHIGFIRLRVDDQENISGVTEQIKEILRRQHRIKTSADDDFTVRSSTEAMQMLGTITKGLQFFLIAIISIALIVSGIGIMNIMLAAVSNRLREIGLRKAVGARDIHIFLQFLIETLVITNIGGLLGIISGSAAAWLISLIVNRLGYDWSFIISIQSIIIAFVFSSLIGLIFGLHPARKAAKLPPISALHYE